jgi:hypothetical protein
MRKVKEGIGSDLKGTFANEVSKMNLLQGTDAINAVNDMMGAIPQNEEEEIIKRKIQKSPIKNNVGKVKMKKPIGKLNMMLPIMGEEGETTEATASGAGGSFVTGLFSEPKRMDSMFKDEQPKKKVKGGFVSENETGPKGSGKFEYEVGGHKQDAFKKHVDEKWSEKYKKSIDCNNPKGFSQKAHCQGRQKVEANEAADSASSGSYETTAAWSKSMDKKDWRGAAKTQIPGGKFVQVKKKCKKFPYCNQGDIKALKIFENKSVQKAITNVSEKHNISENVIKAIIAYEYENSFKDK